MAFDTAELDRAAQTLATALDSAPATVRGTFESALTAAAAAWPTVQASATGFAKALTMSLEPGTDFARQLEALALADLYLATACVEANGPALEHATRTLLPAVIDSLRRVTNADELTQQLTEQLFLKGPDGRPPDLARYAGRAPVVHWLRATALRAVLDQQKKAERRTQIESRSLANVAPVVDVELELIRKLHGHDFREAFEVAFRSLTPRDRTLLRLHTLDGLNIEHIGAMYQTHKTTVFRWLTAARKALAEGIRAALAEKLVLSGSEVESLLDFVGTELDLSLNRLLTSTSVAPK